MPFYLGMSKNITQQGDIYDTVIFRFLQIFYGPNIYIYICIYIYRTHEQTKPISRFMPSK